MRLYGNPDGANVYSFNGIIDLGQSPNLDNLTDGVYTYRDFKLLSPPPFVAQFILIQNTASWQGTYTVQYRWGAGIGNPTGGGSKAPMYEYRFIDNTGGTGIWSYWQPVSPIIDLGTSYPYEQLTNETYNGKPVYLQVFTGIFNSLSPGSNTILVNDLSIYGINPSSHTAWFSEPCIVMTNQPLPHHFIPSTSNTPGVGLSLYFTQTQGIPVLYGIAVQNNYTSSYGNPVSTYNIVVKYTKT